MKLLYITNTKIPSERANAIQVMKMCSSFESYLNVTLLFPFRFQVSKKMKTINNLYTYYNCKNRFSMLKVFSIDLHPIKISASLDRLFYYIQAITFSFFALLVSLFLPKDVFYTRDTFLAFFLTISRFIHRTPVFFEIHSLPKGFESLFFNYSVKHVDGIISISGVLKNELTRLYGVNNIITLHDGVDIVAFSKKQKFDIYKSLSIKKNQSILLYAGHLYPWKGVDDVIDAVKYKKNILFFVVGGLEEDISRLKKRSSSNVFFLGYKSPKEVIGYLKSADFLILPSKTTGNNVSEKFTSPLKLFEYLAVGKPIIVSNHPVFKEVLPKGIINYKMSNVDDLSKKIDFVISNKKKLQGMAKKYPNYVKEFSWGNRAQKIIDFIKGLSRE